MNLTEDGRALLARADAKAVAIEQRIADGFNPEERAQLIELLTRASAQLTGEPEPD
ncbi:hypothetical protein ACFW1A_34860 [Kitasatospora sp. NPDC058965]|uniref:hypothetical protein n=1 Tax=Kitasatospora sp. NPDC058965 TaxID=3346682 RepID=UPI0036D0747D